MMAMILWVIGVIIGLGNYTFVWIYLSMELLIPKTNKKHLIMMTAFGFIVNLLYALLAFSGKIYADLNTEFICYFIQTLFYIGFYKFIYRTNFFKIISAVAISHFFIYNITSAMIGLIIRFTQETYLNPYLNLAAVIFRGFIIFSLTWLIIKIFRRFHVRTLLEQMSGKPLTGIACTIICVTLRMSYYIFGTLNPALKDERYQEIFSDYSTIFFAVTFTFITLILIIFLSVYEANQEKIKSQQAIILQQQNYVQSLEGLQRQMRTFRHDLQNLMAGMYLQASDGETEKVREYLKRSINYFDEQIGHEIKQMGFLSNIHNLEVKSLLLVKLMQAQQTGINCNIEVLRPIDEIGIEAEDFLRCFGILIDNALEEVKKAMRGSINILLLNEKKELNVIVENTIIQKPELNMISQKGYSTKGEGRGLGLYIYHEILKKYHNVIPKTVCAETKFRQEIKIRRK